MYFTNFNYKKRLSSVCLAVSILPGDLCIYTSCVLSLPGSVTTARCPQSTHVVCPQSTWQWHYCQVSSVYTCSVSSVYLAVSLLPGVLCPPSTWQCLLCHSWRPPAGEWPGSRPAPTRSPRSPGVAGGPGSIRSDDSYFRLIDWTGLAAGAVKTPITSVTRKQSYGEACV